MRVETKNERNGSLSSLTDWNTLKKWNRLLEMYTDLVSMNTKTTLTRLYKWNNGENGIICKDSKWPHVWNV